MDNNLIWLFFEKRSAVKHIDPSGMILNMKLWVADSLISLIASSSHHKHGVDLEFLISCCRGLENSE
jgi:hypothetical protein